MPETLLDLLNERARSGRARYHYLSDGREIGASIDLPGLQAHARAVAARLRQSVAPGDRALLLYPPGLDVLPGLFGCLAAGVVAVPVPPLDGARLKHALPRLKAVVADAAPAAILTTADLAGSLAGRLEGIVPDLLWLPTDRLDPCDGPALGHPGLSADSLAYLQYTSGSTGTPRGVMLSHGNVLSNLAYLQRGFACGPDSVCVTWMPYFHDYGLVEGLLQPLYSDADCYILSPLALLKRPVRWLQAIDRFRGTHSHGPNFAYELCLARIPPKQRAELDLSSWQVAGNGAEPVRAETLRRFCAAFGPQGFGARTFYPAYGLAEATLFVAARAHDRAPDAVRLSADALDRHRVVPLPPGAPGAAARESVSCGRPQPGTDLRIVDAETGRSCAPDRVGEIWVASPGVAQGYWRRPEDSRATFQARLADAPAAGPFLRTGDLGFLRDGELHVTGRLKDLIIVAGTNHYPQDIEWTAQQACPELRPGHCVAFGVERDGEERLVILAEAGRHDGDWQPVLHRLRAAVAEAHGLAIAAIAILKRGGIYKTSSGKVQRNACRQAYLEDRLDSLAVSAPPPSPSPSPSGATERRPPDSADLQDWLCREIGGMLSLDPDAIDRALPFAALGLDSRAAVALTAALEDRLGGTDLSPTLLWRHPTVNALADHLSGRPAQHVQHAGIEPADMPGDDGIAIIGLACRLPGAPDAEAFWSLLRDGRCTVRTDPRLPGVEAGFLEEADCFDADFFGLPANEVRRMDPQQRILLEIAWSALEHAGLPPDRLEGSRTGVFVGISSADFAFEQFSRGDAESLVNAYSGTGLAFSIAANRLSYLLDLRGPSMAIDTACSSSLVAVHQACASLRGGECGLALAGGVNLIGGPHLQLALERAGMLSPGRRSRTFDAAADGYVRGEGCGLVVLKRAAAARLDGDRVLAIIRGSAVNQDGRSNGLTAPNPLAQQDVIREALAAAGLEPAHIDYVETHGTGTRLGDPIEVEALQTVLGGTRDAGTACLLGSVKANIGHLEAAAGIAGLIKTVLCLQLRKIPPQPNLQQVNPLIRLADTPFDVPTALRDWPREGPGRAAVSLFGFGGTNAHLVLEQAPPPAADPPAARSPGAQRPRHVLALSARHPDALRALAGRYAGHCRAAPDASAADLCLAAATRRTHHAHRLALGGATAGDFAEPLAAFAAGTKTGSPAPAAAPGVAFLFTGQGAQYPGMGRALYDSEPQFRAILDQCDRLLADALDRPLLSVMFGDDGTLLEQTMYTQPALFALEYGLARLWSSWGVEPSAVLGHSVGEYVAACIAGVFDLETGLRLVARRGRLIQSLPRDGGMLAVMAEEAQLLDLVGRHGGDLCIATVNGPRNVVLSGRRAGLETLQAELDRLKLRSRFLPVSHAFHSALLDPILEGFHATASAFAYRAPQIPLISNLNGRAMEGAPDADYWTRHLREAVRFADGLDRLAAGHRVFLEIGPKPLLCALGVQSGADPGTLWLPSLREGEADWQTLTESLAALYQAGIDPDWAAFGQGADPRSVPDLPGYPFRRDRFALPPRPETADAAAPFARALAAAGPAPPPAPNLDARPDAVPVADWGFLPLWSALPATRGDASADWLLLGDRGGAATALRDLLREAGETCLLVEGPLPDPLPPGQRLLAILCLWPLDLPAAGDPAGPIAGLVARLAGLARALAGQAGRRITLRLVTRRAFALDDRDRPADGDGLLQSPVWGLARGLRREQPDWQVALTDTDGTAGEVAAQLFDELHAATPGEETLWRIRDGAPVRFGLRLTPQALPPPERPFKPRGSWLLTGGLGRLGLLMAGRLVARGARHLLLAGRRPPGTAAARQIAAWRAQGVAVQVACADIADPAAVTGLLDGMPPDWPPLDGLLHAAGILDDGVLHRQPADRILAVMAPKVLGGWALHLACMTHPRAGTLRHFVLISSASGLLGNPGQAAYGAANSFLDALAGYRRARHLPAQSQSWSLWSETSLDPRLAQRLEDHGLAPIEPERGLQALEHALALDLPHVAILPRRADSALTHPLFGNEAAVPPPPASGAPLLRELSSLAPSAREAMLTRHILALVAALSGREARELDAGRGFFDQGFDSMSAIELRNRLQADLDRPLPATIAFDHPTPERLARQLLELIGPVAADRSAPAPPQEPVNAAGTPEGIAIVGMGCRIPGGVTGPDGFWALLRDEVDAITEIPASRWDAGRYYDADPDRPGTIQARHGGFVDGVEFFDPIFFGISPREARHLDPQQRLLLEVGWETLEQAGIPPGSLEGSQTGVFIGISTNDYLQRLNRDPDGIDAYLGTGNALSVAANRLSYFLGLEGPSLAIDTACSSSLVAIHQACQSLRSGECDLAFAGGVNLLLDPTVSINHSRARMLAPDGRCKAFAAEADGFVRSEGCGLVLLKRLSDALRDGDRIQAVIRGSAVNQDGRTSGLTVPNGPAQERVIRRALGQVGLAPAQVGYVEAHGTGTALGDPIEAGALNAVYGEGPRRQPLVVGSVKTNIGHLESAAGIAGLQKVVLALGHGTIPGHLHARNRSPHIDWAQVALRLPAANEAWPDTGGPRRAGVSSFGFGGTNAHAILEQAPEAAARRVPVFARYLLPLSARSPDALRQLARRLLDLLDAATAAPLADLGFTAACGRDHFAHRLALLGDSRDAMAAALRAWLDGRTAGDVVEAADHLSPVHRAAEASAAAPPDGPEAWQPEVWRDLAARYCRGETPDWRMVYAGLPLRRVDFPGHPFARERYWVEPEPGHPAAAVPATCTLEWEAPAATPAAGPAAAPPPQGHWLILSDRDGVGRALADELLARSGPSGLRCTLVDRAPGTGRRRSLPPGDEAAACALLDELGPLQGVVYLWALDAPAADRMRPDDLTDPQGCGLAGLLALSRAIESRREGARLWIVTRDAVAARPGDRLGGLAQTPVWGFGRSLALEVPGIWGGLVDLPATAAAKAAAAGLAAAVAAGGRDSQMALRDGQMLVPRLRPGPRHRTEPVALRPDASYLITGGFGSLGRAIGIRLAELGARHLRLLGRGGAGPPAARRHLEALAARGVTAEVAALDLGDGPALEAAIAGWARSGPPLRGIVHAAGLDGLCAITELTWPACARMLTAKTRGAWALHLATAGMPLDFFLGCSSIAALWGGQRQAAYSAANAFLDGLAAFRRVQGLAGASLNIGPLAGSAMVSAATEAELRRLGLDAFAPGRLTAQLPDLLDPEQPQLAVVAADWPRFAQLYRSRCATGLFDHLAPERTDMPAPAAAGSRGPASSAAGMPLRDRLAAWIGEALGLAPERLDPDAPLPRLGMDSLLAMEVRGRIERDLGLTIPLAELLGAQTLSGLADRLDRGPPHGTIPEAPGAAWIEGEI
ncbi:MAG: SDR family NAD(P)-dependent oxidoreductase [Sneathiellaceae bacterium]